MSTLVTDAKFSNIELTQKTDMLYINTTALLKSIANDQFRLNVNSLNRELGGTFVRPVSLSRVYAKTAKVSKVASTKTCCPGDINTDGIVNAIDACNLLRINKKKLNIGNLSTEQKKLAYPVSSKSGKSYNKGDLPGLSDILYVLKVSAGVIHP